jgi:cysteine desulfurase
MAKIYLDYNATAPLRPNVLAAMTEVLGQCGNPSSVHGFGQAARARIEAVREKIARFVNCTPNQIIFTSGGTEANNTAVIGCGRSRVLVSAIEHDCVKKAKADAEVIPVTADGIVDLMALEKMLAANPLPALVAVMLANNETGVIQPVAEVVKIAKKYGALVHCDAVQALGKMPVDFMALGVDMLALAAHKVGGPLGVGALIFNDAVPLQAYLRGGGQERSRRAGTVNVPAVAGFGALIDALAACMDSEIGHYRDLQQRLESGLPDGRVPGQNAPRLPNVTCWYTPQRSAMPQLMQLDLAGIAVSSGSACSSGTVKPSSVLKAMGFSENEASCALRLSWGWQSTAADIDTCLLKLRQIAANSNTTPQSVSA